MRMKKKQISENEEKRPMKEYKRAADREKIASGALKRRKKKEGA